MKYIALLYGEPDAGPAPGTPQFMQMLGEFQATTTAMAEAGILIDSSPLQPPQTATTVRIRDGETQLSDGPFAEIKEQLGGYYILDCEDLDTALRYAAMIPSAKYGSVEVRPVMVMEPLTGSRGGPEQVFLSLTGGPRCPWPATGTSRSWVP
jgi:hypothetical protein